MTGYRSRPRREALVANNAITLDPDTIALAQISNVLLRDHARAALIEQHRHAESLVRPALALLYFVTGSSPTDGADYGRRGVTPPAADLGAYQSANDTPNDRSGDVALVAFAHDLDSIDNARLSAL